jgi:hypothetical protein
MKSYIVRIYREKPDNPREIVGVVEEVGTEGKKAFTNVDELWEIVGRLKAEPGTNRRATLLKIKKRRGD